MYGFQIITKISYVTLFNFFPSNIIQDIWLWLSYISIKTRARHETIIRFFNAVINTWLLSFCAEGKLSMSFLDDKEPYIVYLLICCRIVPEIVWQALTLISQIFYIFFLLTIMKGGLILTIFCFQVKTHEFVCHLDFLNCCKPIVSPRIAIEWS